MTFCTSIHCMDGRVQEPLIQYLKQYYHIDYVDTITEPGPNKLLSSDSNPNSIESIKSRVDISIQKHGSKLIAVSGHHDCAGNPVNEVTQKNQIIDSVKTLNALYSDVEIIGLWVDENWVVNLV